MFNNYKNCQMFVKNISNVFTCIDKCLTQLSLQHSPAILQNLFKILTEYIYISIIGNGPVYF